MRPLPCVAICRNAMTRRRQATTSLVLPCGVSMGQMGRTWTTDGRNTPRTTEPITEKDYVAFFHQFFGSPTTLPSLLSRMCHVDVRGTSWVVKVPGTTSTPACIMLLIGPARTTMSYGRWRGFVTSPVSPPITSGCSRVRATAMPISKFATSA
jgi:hypothetical protein